jgi:hypothetical protein
MTTGRVVTFMALVLLAGCNNESTPSPIAKLLPLKPKTASPAVKHGPTPEELTSGMVEAVSLAKSNVPIDMKFQLSQRPAMGQPLEIVVALLPQVAADSAILKVVGSDGLQLATDSTSMDFPAIDSGEAYLQTIKLTPTTEGVQLLTLTVSLKTDESTESRSFSVPVIVGTAATTATVPGNTVKH